MHGGVCLLSLQIMRVGREPGAANISKTGKDSKRKPASLPLHSPSPFFSPLPVASPQAMNRPSGREGRCFNLASYGSGETPKTGTPTSLSCGMLLQSWLAVVSIRHFK